MTPDGFDLAVTEVVQSGWLSAGPLGAGAMPLRNLLLRIVWCGIFPERGVAGMPAGWFGGSARELLTIPLPAKQPDEIESLSEMLARVWTGEVEELIGWIQPRVSEHTCPFEAAISAADLEILQELAARVNQGTS